jgi:hypothetical protein
MRDDKMKDYKKTLTFSLMIPMLVGTSLASAKGGDAPRGCYDEGYKFDHKMLFLKPHQAGKKDSVYFIYNKSNQSVNLFQARSDGKYHGEGLNNTIGHGQWGAYSTDEKEIKFICTVRDSTRAYGHIVSCKDHFKVCEFSNVTYGVNNRGNYWMAHSTSRSGAIKRANYWGVLLSN